MGYVGEEQKQGHERPGRGGRQRDGVIVWVSMGQAGLRHLLGHQICDLSLSRPPVVLSSLVCEVTFPNANVSCF